ncbi:MAG: TetR/AcrR family transcriptional regulator [Myxococcota bacterium]
MARHKEFDPDQALDKAMMAFWHYGYTATTMQRLVEATGVVRASLYATYGNKADIFKLALERYGQRQAARMAGLPREQMLARWFEVTIADSQRDDVPNGCLLVTAASDYNALPPDVQGLIHIHLERIRAFFLHCVQREHDEPTALQPLVESIHAANIGMYVLSRSGAPPQQLQHIADHILSEVNSRP